MGGNNSKPAADYGTQYSQPKPVEGENYSKPLPYKKLPKELQDLADNEETLWDSVYEGQYVALLSRR